MMTARERMLATLAHQKPDRVPIELNWRREVWAAMRQYYGLETDREVAQLLSADMVRTVQVSEKWPEWEKRVNGELDIPYGNIGRTVFLDERTIEDPWGVIRRLGADGKYLERVSGPFRDTDDLDAFDWPTEANLSYDIETMRQRVQELKAAGYWVM